MEFLILNREKIKTVSNKLDRPHIVISMTELENGYPELPENQYRIDVLKLCFTDEDRYEEARFYGRENLLFDRVLANVILDFVEIYKDKVELIISQCDGGISRSSGVAAALSVILNGNRSDNWIFESKSYIPNRLVYRTILTKYLERQEE